MDIEESLALLSLLTAHWKHQSTTRRQQTPPAARNSKCTRDVCLHARCYSNAYYHSNAPWPKEQDGVRVVLPNPLQPENTKNLVTAGHRVCQIPGQSIPKLCGTRTALLLRCAPPEKGGSSLSTLRFRTTRQSRKLAFTAGSYRGLDPHQSDFGKELRRRASGRSRLVGSQSVPFKLEAKQDDSLSGRIVIIMASPLV